MSNGQYLDERTLLISTLHDSFRKDCIGFLELSDEDQEKLMIDLIDEYEGHRQLEFWKCQKALTEKEDLPRKRILIMGGSTGFQSVLALAIAAANESLTSDVVLIPVTEIPKDRIVGYSALLHDFSEQCDQFIDKINNMAEAYFELLSLEYQYTRQQMINLVGLINCNNIRKRSLVIITTLPP